MYQLKKLFCWQCMTNSNSSVLFLTKDLKELNNYQEANVEDKRPALEKLQNLTTKGPQ